ncbi:hypothetical protein JTE90_023378 [Oedothorax gibbosus]|uniref:Bromo domain-containing protein n=1 Tax=Oedothorax gibbosus TaxID=931172 RepID=A0AAV6V1I4_9ARAC|nr:hypothetical protein JTE90_023378 [Oedothorax gibbosus]
MENKKKISNLESELYLLIAKFLSTGPCKESAELLRKEIEKHELLPKRVDWLGNEHIRSFDEFDSVLSQIADDHLLKVCARVGPILDKEIPPTVSGLTSLLGVGRQSLLRTKEDLQKPKCQMSNLIARKNGMPLFPSHAVQSTYPPNIAQVLISRETSGVLTTRHTFTPKVYARQQLYRRILGHLSSVYCVLFDRTGKYIFTGADDLLVKIWSALDGRLLSALRGHSAEITDMAVNHENTLLAAGSCDKTIRVWCLRTTAPVAVLSGHTGMVTSLQFCPYPKNDERLLISTGNDGCVCFWHWNSRNNTFNPKPVRFTERNKANAQMICSSFSSGGLFLATGSTDNSVRVYNIAGTTGPEKVLEREVHTDRVDSLQFSNKDCRFVSGSKDGTALLWKYEKQNWTSITLKMNTKLAGQSEEPEDTKAKLRVTMVGWTLDDDRVITAVSDHTIKVWNSYNGNLCYVLKGHEDEVFVLEPHPTDSRVFLSSGHDGRIIIWDLVTGTIIKNYFNLIEGQGHGAVFDCKFSPDGLSFASTDSHGHLSIFGFGSVDRYKKVPEEQFFHTDYRPLIRDIHHHVLDEQTQTAPHLLPPPFLVDIDGNPYPPNFQRLVPGREHHNDSQLVPYVAVSAEGDSEILEPVRPANDNNPDRPTIDDMIERLQQERNQTLQNNNMDSNDNSSQRVSTDSTRSQANSNRRSVNGNGEPSVADPLFSPRTPRSQAAHSRVGLRRTGDVEGVQSVGHWQSRGNDPQAPASSKRVVVQPMKPSMYKYEINRRMGIADYELSFFNREKKRRSLQERCEVQRNPEVEKRRSGNRAGLRSQGMEDNSNPPFEEAEQPDTAPTSSSDSETEEENDNEMTNPSDSDYSDWTENHQEAKETRSKAKANPQRTTSGPTRRSTSARQRRLPRRLVSSGEDRDSDDENQDYDDDESSPNSDKPVRRPKKKPPTPKKKKKAAVNGKKLPERFRPPQWLTDVMPHKSPYVPQIGDQVVYFRQGHELYVQAVKRNKVYEIYMRNQPWRIMNLRDQEVAKIEDITFENRPPRLCCLQLRLTEPANENEDSFTVKYHDMPDVIDFIVLKQNYDQAMYYDWKPGDSFRSAIDSAWWLGTIKSQKPLNHNFPDSMFQCFLVKWDNGEKEHMSPWDFEPVDSNRVPPEPGGSVPIIAEEKIAMMYVPEPHEWSDYGQDHDCERIAKGLMRIMELEIAESFTAPVDLNLYPSYAIVVEYPMDLGTIKARVQNRFYRRVDAIKFDVRFIELNAQKFNEPASRIVKQAKCVVDLCIKFINADMCSDPMIFYNEMLEAKQSRSQDSQSELDVLCSELDSDGEQSTSTRIKRKKQNNLQNSNKRVRLENQKYTSSSWRQQAAELLNTFFQCEDSTPFRQPVNLNLYPDYRNIIDIPMDLSTVREKLKDNMYDSPTDFRKDMRLIFMNSRNYNTNKKSRIYSMTLRMSAMFEELIRSIVGDWRSAVKYEEKIENNQYVSSRRKPLPVQDAEINIGASTSRGAFSSLPSSSRSSNDAFGEGSSRGHSSKMSNGNAAVLTNGDRRHARVLKRKMGDRSPRTHSGRKSHIQSYNEELSLSDTNSTIEENDSNNADRDWNATSRRPKKDSSPRKKRRKKISPIKKSTRPTRTTSNHRPFASLRTRSSSPDDHAYVARSHKESPLLKRSTRLRNSGPRPTYSQDDSESDYEQHETSSKEPHFDHNSNGSSEPKFARSSRRLQLPAASSESSRSKRSSPVNNNEETSKSLSSHESEGKLDGKDSDKSYSESDDNSEEDSEEKPRRGRRKKRDSDYEYGDNSEEESEEKPRRGRRSKQDSDYDEDSRDKRTKRASVRPRYVQQGRIQTRNRGQRTVKYRDLLDDSDEDYEHTGTSSRPLSGRGLRCQLTGGEQNHQNPDNGERLSNCSSAQGGNSGINSMKTSKQKSSFKHASTLLHGRSLKLKVTRSPVSKVYRKGVGNRVFSVSGQNCATNISYSLRKCSELIKRSLKRPYSRMAYSKNAAVKGSGVGSNLRLKITRPQVINLRTARKINVGNKSSTQSNAKKNSPISFNTRSHQYDTSNSSVSSEVSTKGTEKTRKPTIVFCKPLTASGQTDSRNKVKGDSDSACSKLSESYLASKRRHTSSSKHSTETSDDSSSKNEVTSCSNSSDNSNVILENNKSKWCLRKPNSSPRISGRGSQSSSGSEAGSSKVQTRNQGQRTVTYTEDSIYLTEILENEDPVKQRRRHNSDPARTPKERPNTSTSNSQDRLETPATKSSVSTRTKKEALKILSNGIETRNHGQRTTLYAEDGDDYLEEYFASLGS